MGEYRVRDDTHIIVHPKREGEMVRRDVYPIDHLQPPRREMEVCRGVAVFSPGEPDLPLTHSSLRGVRDPSRRTEVNGSG